MIERVRLSALHFDLLVVNDGCQDGTRAVLEELGVVTAWHVKTSDTAARYGGYCLTKASWPSVQAIMAVTPDVRAAENGHCFLISLKTLKRL